MLHGFVIFLHVYCILVAVQECSIPSTYSDALARRRAAFECVVGIAGASTSGGAELAPAEVPYQSKRKRFANKKSSSFRERKPAKDGYMKRRSSTCNAPTIVSDYAKCNGDSVERNSNYS